MLCSIQSSLTTMIIAKHLVQISNNTDITRAPYRDDKMGILELYLKEHGKSGNALIYDSENFLFSKE